MLRSVCVHKSEALFLFKKKPHQAPPKASSTTQLQPLPQPLSEWRGEWRPLFANKEKPLPQPLSEWRGEWRLLFANKEGVLSNWRKALFITKKRPSRLEKGVFLILKYNYLYSHLPSSHILLVVFTPPLHYFPSVSDRWFREGERLLLTCSH